MIPDRLAESYGYRDCEWKRARPSPGATGICQNCGRDMVPKCGEQLVWHWAHKNRRKCGLPPFRRTLPKGMMSPTEVLYEAGTQEFHRRV
ncbi:competence protein CoiA family protein [Pseudoduganella violacea]|uniref:competence protein CoiA family protein n=1 Tax=Pseudoduganella violacea TaxID=1715466 RepID=UPI003FCE1864